MTDRTTDWLNGCLVGWLVGWLAAASECLCKWLTGWLTDWPTDWLTNWLTDWLAGWLTDWPTNWLAYWLTYCLTDQHLSSAMHWIYQLVVRMLLPIVPSEYMGGCSLDHLICLGLVPSTILLHSLLSHRCLAEMCLTWVEVLVLVPVVVWWIHHWRMVTELQPSPCLFEQVLFSCHPCKELISFPLFLT